MGKLSVALFLVAVSLPGFLAGDDEALDVHWETYKVEFEKVYDSPEEEEKGKKNFKDNVYEAVLHNLDDDHTYTKGIHEHSDKSPEEVLEQLCGTELPADADNITRRNFMISGRLDQDSWNWVDKGRVSPVKNQGSCGSCWAFATAQSVEGQAAWRYGNMYKMSQQQMVDCASDYGNNGCDGGWPQSAMKYIKEKGGIVMESCYPYTGKDGTCSIKDSCYRFELSGYTSVGPKGDENAVANALYRNGPLTSAIFVNDHMMDYTNGVFSDDKCTGQVNHAVLLVGYGNQDGQDYWLVKNSWGSRWGENGYIKIARNKGNMCSIASYTAYPTLK